MVKKKKPKISDAVDALNSQAVESPFGILDDEYEPTVRKKVRAIDKLKAKQNAKRAAVEKEDMSFFEGLDANPVLPKKKKKKKRTREVIMFPEKQNFDSPKKSKLNKASREIEAMQGKLSNIVKVPKEQLDTFMQVYNDSSKNISTEFLASIAPTFLAFEDSMNYSTVALRDGLSYDGEIDMELAPLLEWATRLNVLELFLTQLTSLSEETKTRIVRLATMRAVEKAFMSKGPAGGLTGTHNKVAGIVTQLTSGAEKTKTRKALETVQKLKQSADRVKNSGQFTHPTPGVILKKKRFNT
jgi:hypothetical protein